jgi:uncharacterized membrane protein
MGMLKTPAAGTHRQQRMAQDEYLSRILKFLCYISLVLAVFVIGSAVVGLVKEAMRTGFSGMLSSVAMIDSVPAIFSIVLAWIFKALSDYYKKKANSPSGKGLR